MMEASVDAINSLALDTVKFHQLQLFRGTTMAAQYAADPGRFHFFSRDEYVDFFIGLLERLRPDLVVERFAQRGAAALSSRSYVGVRAQRATLVVARTEARAARHMAGTFVRIAVRR